MEIEIRIIWGYLFLRFVTATKYYLNLISKIHAFLLTHYTYKRRSTQAAQSKVGKS